MGSTAPVVVTDKLTKRYGEFTALDNLSISLDRGNILGFIGPNGAGKTTTIKILVGLAKPTSGTAHIAGCDCTQDAKKIKRLVGYMPDKFGSYHNMRVREYLDFFGAAFGIHRRDRTKRVAEVLEITNAAWMQDRYVESLSHGMQQRIGIARTLLHDPAVLILDEPANGLDPQARIEMREIILKLAAVGKTLIVTSHILPELSRICDRVAIVTQGKLRAFGTLEEITRKISQKRTIEVELANAAQLNAAAEIIAGLGESGAEIATSPTESTVRFRTSKPENELGELLSRLVRANITVNQFSELQSDLEEAFLAVTRDTTAPQKERKLEEAPPRRAAAGGQR
ncbi:MAG: ABC transporter ATP-binding protein [Planctomycetaceae bacterium]